ncbi:MAG TPA: pilus assembly protein PilM [Usitatibacter sp.]|nr:pilus assembly protein PilM [Usitatibacter sp.]
MAASTEGLARPHPAWKQKLQSFWRWWTGQLALLVPERFAALGGAGRVPLIALESDDIVLIEPRVSGESRVAAGDVQAERVAVRRLLERAGEGRGRARLALDAREALVRRTTMPAATEENLAQVLAFEMDRLTPFRADEVYFDHRVVSRDAAAGTLGVLLAVARREPVDRCVARLRALGVTVEGVTVRDDALLGAAPLNLMPAEQRGQRETPRERLVKQVLAGLVGVLLICVLFYPPWIKRERIKALHPVEAKAQSEAQATDKLAQELERLAAEHNFLLAKKHGTPPALAYIEEVTRLLPDNTWVQQLDLKVAGKTRELQIQGETASSSRLIEILEQSTLLRNAAPRGTVTRGSQPGTERFAIAAEAKGRPQPEATPVAQLSTPIVPSPRPEAAKSAPPKAPNNVPAAAAPKASAPAVPQANSSSAPPPAAAGPKAEGTPSPAPPARVEPAFSTRPRDPNAGKAPGK